MTHISNSCCLVADLNCDPNPGFSPLGRQQNPPGLINHFQPFKARRLEGEMVQLLLRSLKNPLHQCSTLSFPNGAFLGTISKYRSHMPPPPHIVLFLNKSTCVLVPTVSLVLFSNKNSLQCLNNPKSQPKVFKLNWKQIHYECRNTIFIRSIIRF